MLMSKSRLEKFLYALYSLDSSDLPTPLSRIEELYKCWVTGEEAPTFEPLSRVEKYLMAILGGYDVDLLPNPISRVEVLLYKLATGDDNLDDIESFLSKHEELLAGIIRNGGVGGNIDIEYVLYTLSTEFNTLYNTAEKPVKSAILKGDSQRVFSPTKNLFDGELEQGTVSSSTGNNSDLSTAIRSKNFVEIGVNTAFTLSRKKGTASLGFRCYDKNKNFLGTIFTAINAGTLKVTYTTDSNTVYIRFIDNTNDLTNKYQIEIGSTATDYEEPNYELKSVKMPVLTTTGKNLFDGKLENGAIISSTGNNTPSTDNVRSVGYIKVNPNASIVLSNDLNYSNNIIYEYDSNKDFIGRKETNPFTTSTNCQYIRFRSNSNQSNLDVKYQIEYGTRPTTYEPYKSNILTVNEDVELRGIGDVQNTLNLMTAELTSSLGEVVLDGTQKRMGSQIWGNYTKTRFELIGAKDTRSGRDDVPLMSDKLKPYGYWGEADNGEYFFTGNNYIDIVHSKEKDIVQWLKDNPTLIIYPLIESTIKTVDLSIVDQDGNDTKLSTFDDITYVTLSSEGLIPESELEVATKNKEVLSTMSLEMNDISTTQNALQETSDIQSENIDATMIATTEIYEGLL